MQLVLVKPSLVGRQRAFLSGKLKAAKATQRWVQYCRRKPRSFYAWLGTLRAAPYVFSTTLNTFSSKCDSLTTLMCRVVAVRAALPVATDARNNTPAQFQAAMRKFMMTTLGKPWPTQLLKQKYPPLLHVLMANVSSTGPRAIPYKPLGVQDGMRAGPTPSLGS